MLDHKKYYTLVEAAAYLNIKEKTLYAIKDKIPHYRVGRMIRFKREDLDAWMESLKVFKDV